MRTRILLCKDLAFAFGYSSGGVRNECAPMGDAASAAPAAYKVNCPTGAREGTLGYEARANAVRRAARTHNEAGTRSLWRIICLRRFRTCDSKNSLKSADSVYAVRNRERNRFPQWWKFRIPLPPLAPSGSVTTISQQKMFPSQQQCRDAFKSRLLNRSIDKSLFARCIPGIYNSPKLAMIPIARRSKLS